MFPAPTHRKYQAATALPSDQHQAPVEWYESDALMHRALYQVCYNSSCSAKIKVDRRTRLLQLIAVFNPGDGLLSGGPRKCLNASGG